MLKQPDETKTFKESENEKELERSPSPIPSLSSPFILQGKKPEAQKH